MDDVASESRRDQPGSEVVASVRGPADERKLLHEALPSGGQDIEPDVVGVPRKCVGQALVGGRCVIEHRSADHLEDGLSGQTQPLGR